MSGLRKQKEYDWRDSNVAKVGSKEDRKFKKDAAKKEPAWKGTENLKDKEMRIWRIEKFEVKDWPKEKYGRFYSGDSYIILHAEKDPDTEELEYDIHFWIGKESTQDEYGTAAYKTVELDAYLDDKPVQHREVQGKESEELKECFESGIIVDEGGIETGFTHVDVEKPFCFPRTVMLHYKKVKIHDSNRHAKEEKEEYRAVEVPYSKKNMQFDGYVVIFTGDAASVIQIQPENAAKHSFSFSHLNTFWTEQKQLYPKADFHIFDSLEELKHDEQFSYIYKDAFPKQEAPDEHEFKIRLFRVSTDRGKGPSFTEVPRKADQSDAPLMDMSGDAFIMETQNGLLVWIGKEANSKEKEMAFSYADKHAGKNCSCTVRAEGKGRFSASWKTFYSALQDFAVQMPDEGKKFLGKQQQMQLDHHM